MSMYLLIYMIQYLILILYLVSWGCQSVENLVKEDNQGIRRKTRWN